MLYTDTVIHQSGTDLGTKANETEEVATRHSSLVNTPVATTTIIQMEEEYNSQPSASIEAMRAQSATAHELTKRHYNPESELPNVTESYQNGVQNGTINHTQKKVTPYLHQVDSSNHLNSSNTVLQIGNRITSKHLLEGGRKACYSIKSLTTSLCQEHPYESQIASNPLLLLADCATQLHSMETSTVLVNTSSTCVDGENLAT